MGKNSRIRNKAKSKKISYMLGIGIGVLMGIVLGMGGSNYIVSIILCGLLGFGMGHAI